jgi:hypothetical protein
VRRRDDVVARRTAWRRVHTVMTRSKQRSRTLLLMDAIGHFSRSGKLRDRVRRAQMAPRMRAYADEKNVPRHKKIVNTRANAGMLSSDQTYN